MPRLNRLPLAAALKGYSRTTLSSDLTAALIVTVMLVPQSLAYALLAGLPAVTGLYASIIPLVLYALFGSSNTLSVGPVAIASLMTASATAHLASTTGQSPVFLASLLALLSGVMLFGLGLLRGGFIADLLSHPVVSGFITASALLIAWGQLTPLLGGNPLEGAINPATATLGLASLGALWSARQFLNGLWARIAPLAIMALATLAVAVLGLETKGVAVVGDVPTGLPTLQLPLTSFEGLKALLLPSALISLIGFVESISVGRTLAKKDGSKIHADKELLGLGAANIGAGLFGGFPVTGGISRSVVNLDAGAKTQIAGLLVAAFIALTTLFLTPLLRHVPQGVLAATIIVSILKLVDLATIRHTGRYSKADLAALLVTFAATFLLGVEAGIGLGVGLSVILVISRSARPHIAEIGRIKGADDYRNILRYDVDTLPNILALRIDGSLYFANARWISEDILARIAHREDLQHLILNMTAANMIDISGLEALEQLCEDLATRGITLHLAEVKGPVSDKFKDRPLNITGKIFRNLPQAFDALSKT